MAAARLTAARLVSRGSLGEALRAACGPALCGQDAALHAWLGSPASLRWLSTGAAPPLDEGQAAEVARALRSQQLLEALEPLRASTSAVPHRQLLEYAEQQ